MPKLGYKYLNFQILVIKVYFKKYQLTTYQEELIHKTFHIPLKNQAEIYPGALKKNLINFFIFEAEFSLMFVKANARAEDKYYIAGHVFRIISCLNQVLFACNNAYCINEKKAIKLIETFEYKPEKYAERVNHIFEVLGLSLFECYDLTEKLYKEVKKIATEMNNFLNEGNSDERKQI